ncbi:RHS repeat-associated core domain-containing protein [Pseudomonas viridiflava]|uniref:RHS repeat-associated core domain-containing protein n=1 Tax=Pseudomonas viridiflava TaxID=33069 RepID=UPI000F01802B|nr:RHS repeat-associated core domain-containing protein [Pseudomonas viridiflava]
MAHIAGETRCRYRYDALDRMASSEAEGQACLWRFYQRDRLSTQIQGQIRHSLLHADEHLLAFQQKQNEGSYCELLATDQQSSVIATPQSVVSYTPYGNRHPYANPLNLPGFTGQQADSVTGHYLLGNGYRAFNPSLMRFNSPDNLSPFGRGGLNAYAYCQGDPVNRADPTGHWPGFLKSFLRAAGIMKKAKPKDQGQNVVSETVQSTNNIHTALLIPKENTGVKRLRLGKRTSLASGIYMFDELTENDKLALTINSHAAPPLPLRGPRLVSTKKTYVSPKQLTAMLEANGVDLSIYESIHLIGCNTATGDEISFAAKMAHLTGKKTTGYRGLVTNRNMRAIRDENNHGPQEIAITNPFEKDSANWTLFNYDPVTFTPP